MLEFPIIRDLTEIALWPASCTCHRQHPELFSSSFSAAFLKDVDKFTNAKVNFLSILLQRREPGAAIPIASLFRPACWRLFHSNFPSSPIFPLLPAFPDRQDARLSSFCIIALVIVVVDILAGDTCACPFHTSQPLSLAPCCPSLSLLSRRLARGSDNNSN